MADQYLILTPDPDSQSGFSAYEKFWLLNDRIERHLGIPNQHAQQYAFPMEHPSEYDLRVIIPIDDRALSLLTQEEKDQLLSAEDLEQLAWFNTRIPPKPSLWQSFLNWWGNSRG